MNVLLELVKGCPSWTRAALALFAAVSVAGYYGYREVAQPELRMAALNADVSEMSKHLTEPSTPVAVTLLEDAPRRTKVTAVAWSDECVALTAQRPDGRVTRWVRMSDSGTLRASLAEDGPLRALGAVALPAVHAQCANTGRCDPSGWHPGQPESQWQESGAGWVRVHRQWRHGGGGACYHIQTIDTQTGAYTIHWVCCVH